MFIQGQNHCIRGQKYYVKCNIKLARVIQNISTNRNLIVGWQITYYSKNGTSMATVGDCLEVD